jgi:enterobactin synthetase component F
MEGRMSVILPPSLRQAQTAIWLDQQLFPTKPIYNTGQVLTIRGILRFELFELALRETVAESPWLQLPPRTGAVAFDLPLIDFRDRKDPSVAARQWMQDEMRRVLPLDGRALFRFALLRVSDDLTLWFQKWHHIIIDATGRRLLSARTAARYRALRFDEPLFKINAAAPDELLDDERRYAASSDYEIDRVYWSKRFANWFGPLLEGNRENTERAKSGRPNRIAFTLERADFARLENAARTLGSSAFRAIIALTYVAFSRLYNRSDIVFGLELASRSDPRAKQVIGLLARPMPIALQFDPATTIADAVHRIDELRMQDHPHRRFPVQELVRDLGITRKGYHGLFDVIVNYIPASYDFAFEGSSVEMTNLSYGFTTSWMVTIADSAPNRDIDVVIDTDPGLVSADTAAQLATAVQTLLLNGLQDPTCSLASLPIMPDATKRQLFDFRDGETVTVPQAATLATLCAAQAQRTPDAIALIHGESQLSFATLHSQAERLAARLTALGVRPGVIVGMALPRTPLLVIAVLAVHKAGGAYLALDPAYPAERIRFMVADAAAPLILTDAQLAPLFADCGAQLVVDADSTDVPMTPVQSSPARPDDLAYVLYTSGSTGRPKAVGIEHRNLINLISWGRSILSDAELSGMLFSTSLNFDLSAFELFVPLAFGGCIIMVENLLALPSSPPRDKVRVVNTGPSLIEAMLRLGALPPNVTTLILAGERLSQRLATSLLEALPGLRLLNCYGPTETTVYSSYATVRSDRSEPSIGRPIWNTSLHALTAGRALLPPGLEGELFIGGAGVARGYLGRPELTAERFLSNPHGDGQLYRTGDRVRWRRNGELEFLGRADDQLKINGIRVEPGEIETTLLRLPEIAAAVVALSESIGNAPRLVAYLVATPGAAPSTDGVRDALERQLPRNMVPALFVWLDAMPMTPNGKIDRKALPEPPLDEGIMADNPAPSTQLEHDIAEIWIELLQLSSIGVRSDFFDLGGDSLALLSLFATIEAQYGRRLTVDALAGGLTIARLAQLLARDEPLPTKMDPVVALQPLGDLPPFFCVHGIGGDVLHLHRLSTHMGIRRPFFGLRRTADDPLTDTIEQIATRYVAAVLAHQPTGPFYLGGHSFGAVVAYEMASQLSAQGHQIGLLAIIDQNKPGWRLTPRTAAPALYRVLANIPRSLRDALAQAPGANRLQKASSVILRWARAALGIRKNAVAMFGINESETDRISLFEAHLRALREYQAHPATVPIALFRADVPLMSHAAMDPMLGWTDLAKCDVRLRTVPGNHLSITTEPLVRHLANALSVELDAAQRSHHRQKSLGLSPGSPLSSHRRPMTVA